MSRVSRGLLLVCASLSLSVGLLAGCGSDGGSPDQLAQERAANPAVAALLDGRADAAAAELLVPEPAADGRITAAALGARDQNLDDAALATWLVWRAAYQPDEAAAHGLLGVDLTTELGSDWRLRREYDVAVAGSNEAAENREAVYEDVARTFEAVVERQLAADLAGPQPVAMPDLNGLQRALVLAVRSAVPPTDGPLLELLGEVLAAQQLRCLAYRAWRLAVRAYVSRAESQMESPDTRWKSAFAAAHEGDLAAVNQLLAQNPRAPGAAWLKRAGWCSWFMRQIRGDVGTADDVWFSEYRIRTERGEPVGDLVDEPPVALRAQPLPVGTVVALSAIGLLVLLVLVRLVRRYSRRLPTPQSSPSRPAS